MNGAPDDDDDIGAIGPRETLLKFIEQQATDARDAVRYRWLRSQPNNTYAPRIDVVRWSKEDEASNSGDGLRMGELDAAIDAAMAAEKKEPK